MYQIIITNSRIFLKKFSFIDKRNILLKPSLYASYITSVTGHNPKLTFHTMRASFGSWLVQKGCNIYDVMTLMGHSDVRVTTQFYASLTTDNLRESVNLLNN